jgi:hypothetical protein
VSVCLSSFFSSVVMLMPVCQGAGAGRIRGAEWQLANGLLLRTGPQTDGQTV